MSLPRPLQTLLTVLPVLSAGLYLLGLSYHQGYLDAFGLDDSLFPLSSDKALFKGFFSLVIVAFPAGVYAAFAIGSFVILIALAAILSSSARVRSIGAYIKKRFSKKPTPAISSTAEVWLDKSAVVYGYVAGIVVGVALLVMIVGFSAKTGREQAEKEIKTFLEGRSSTVKLYSSQHPQEFVGRLVMCSSAYCAVWSNSGTLVIRHEAISRMVIHNPSHNGNVVNDASAP